VRIFDRYLGRRLGAELRQAIVAQRLHRFSTSPSRISGVLIESIEHFPDDESTVVKPLIESFVAAKAEQSSSPVAYLPGAEWKRMLESEWAEPLATFERRDADAIAAFSRNFFRNAGLNGSGATARCSRRSSRLTDSSVSSGPSSCNGSSTHGARCSST
jgi:hypothetical protein